MENKLKIIGIFGILFMLSIIISPKASALGISVNKEIAYVPNSSTEVDLCFRNSKNEADTFEVTKEGELDEYITFNFPEIITLGAMKTECYSYTIKMPEEMKHAGLVSSLILAKELPAEASGGGGIQFNILVGVNHKISLRVPYPGKYLDTYFESSNVKAGDPAIFSLRAISRGSEIIQKLSGTAQIYDVMDNTMIKEIRFTEAVNIKTNEEVFIKAIWDTTGIKSGNYKVKATINFDEKSEVFEKEFKVGSMEINIINYTTTAYNDSISKFDVNLLSNWNDPIENVNTLVNIKKSDVYNVEFRMPSITISPFSYGITSSYWETKGLPTGTYNVMVITSYMDKEVEKKVVKTGTIELLERELEKPSPLNTTTLLILIIIIMVIINIAWVVYSKVKKNKGNPPLNNNNNVNNNYLNNSEPK